MSDTDPRKPKHMDRKINAIASQVLVPEIRNVICNTLEIRDATDNPDGPIIISGTPILYDKAYPVKDRLGSYNETVRAGAAKSTLGRDDVRLLLGHNQRGMVYARSGNGTLTLDDRPDGLHFTAELDPASPDHRSLAVAIRRGDISGMSFGFFIDPAADQWNTDMTERSIGNFSSIFEISAVPFPMNGDTSIEVATRRALEMPVAESLTWLDEIVEETRAGRVLSSSHVSALADAVKGIHGVLAGAGFDVSSLMPEPPAEAEPESEITVLDDNDDGTSNVDVSDDSGAGDASGMRDLELLLEADRSKRQHLRAKLLSLS